MVEACDGAERHVRANTLTLGEVVVNESRRVSTYTL